MMTTATFHRSTPGHGRTATDRPPPVRERERGSRRAREGRKHGLRGYRIYLSRPDEMIRVPMKQAPAKYHSGDIIKGLVDDHGTRHEDSNTMRSMVHDYFSHLFQSEVHEVNDEVLNAVKVKVTPAMNQGLLAPFSYEEVKHALFSIGDLKAPGPDGLHAIFYKRF